MRALNLSAVVMAAGLLIASQAFAQARKQPTQEGGPSMPTVPNASNNANPGGDPNYKQRTQEGGSGMPLPCGQPFNAKSSADPNCKQVPAVQK
jgi:hypothetical protein